MKSSVNTRIILFSSVCQNKDPEFRSGRECQSEMCDVARRKLKFWLSQRSGFCSAMGSERRRDPVQSLPEEVLHMVWSRLELKDLMAASSVSRSWNETLARDNTWKRFCREGAGPLLAQGTWKRRFLAERSLLYNWGHNKYHTFIKIPLTGKVTAGDKEIYVLEDDGTVGVLSTECKERGTLDLGGSAVSVRESEGWILVATDKQELVLVSGKQVVGRVPGGKLVAHRGSKVAMETTERIVLTDVEYSHEVSVSMPEAKWLDSLQILDNHLLARLRPVDNNYEALYQLADLRTGVWSIVSKSPTTPLGPREYLEYSQGDLYLLVNLLRVEETFMYSNVQLYQGERLVHRDVIANCRVRYFAACFGEGSLVYSVADYRLVSLDLVTMRPREVYVRTGFEGLDPVLGGYLVVRYPDKLEVWSSQSLRRLYSVPLIERDSPVVRGDFVAITSWPCLSLPPSLRVLSFKEPSLSCLNNRKTTPNPLDSCPS